jgi:hypothetical protein
MSGPVMAHSIGAELVRALGLPPRTRACHLRFVTGEVVTVDCEYFPDRDGVEQAISLLKRYELHELREMARPKLQLSPDFKWCTPEFRAETDRWLLERFGTKPMSEP